MPRQGIVSACSVQEGAFPLWAGARNGSATVASGIKDQTAAPGERVSTDPSDWQWKLQYPIARHCVHVGLDSRFSETAKILLRISVVTVIAFHRKPTVKVITVSQSESTGFRASLLGSQAAGVSPS